MSFLDLVRREMQGSLTRLACVSIAGGISQALILASINAGVQAAEHGQVGIWSTGVFIIALLLFIQTQHYILITTTAEIGAIIHKLRVRMMDYVRRAELLPLEGIGRAQIVAAITMETTTLTQASNTFAFAIQGTLMIALVTAYVAYLSFLAFLLSVVIIGVGAALFHAKSRQLAADMREAATWENRLFDRLTDVLDGFKEVRLNHARSDDLFDDIVEVSRSAANLKIRTQSETFRRMIFLQSSLYTVLGAVALVVPAFSESIEGNLTKAVTALVFVVGACSGLVQSIPIVAAANNAAERIESLEARLREATSVADAIEPPRKSFNTVQMRGVEFSYVDASSNSVFKVGPLDFTLNSGELVILTGGNGSGKSTFMKLLAGFYRPDAGEILIDGTSLNDENFESYRSLIAAIFPDFHLFERLYGISHPDAAEVDRLLAEFRLFEKTRLKDGEFRTVDLSSGQRRRLALIVSILEKRPILLLDEWAADQDPEFRRQFYFKLLPSLNQAGVTIVAISHDDRYIEQMDIRIRKLHMDEGHMFEQTSVETGDGRVS